jgi:hypothetical protein
MCACASYPTIPFWIIRISSREGSTDLRRDPGPRMSPERSPDQQLLDLVARSRSSSVWRASSATIAVPGEVITSAGVAWLVHFHVYGVRRRLTRASRVEFTCGFTVQPKSQRLTPHERTRLRRERWLTHVESAVRRLGYSGEWSSSPYGPFAHFTRRLRGISAVPDARTELARIRGVIERPSNNKMQQTSHG